MPKYDDRLFFRFTQMFLGIIDEKTNPSETEQPVMNRFQLEIVFRPITLTKLDKVDNTSKHSRKQLFKRTENEKNNLFLRLH